MLKTMYTSKLHEANSKFYNMKWLYFLLILSAFFSCTNEKEKRLLDIMHNTSSQIDDLHNIFNYFDEKIKTDLIDKNLYYFDPNLIGNANIDAVKFIMYPNRDTCIVVYYSNIAFPYTEENTKQSILGYFKLVLAKQDTTGWELAYTLGNDSNITDTVYCAEIRMPWEIKTYTYFKQIKRFRNNLLPKNIVKALLRESPYPDCIYCDKAQIERLLKREYWFDNEQNMKE